MGEVVVMRNQAEETAPTIVELALLILLLSYRPVDPYLILTPMAAVPFRQQKESGIVVRPSNVTATGGATCE